MWMPSESLSIWVSSSQKGHWTHQTLMRFFYCILLIPNEFCKGSCCLKRILDFQWQWRWVTDSWSPLKSNTYNAPSCWHLAGPRGWWQVSFPLTVPAGWQKWTVLITERHFEMGLHQAVIKGECLYNRGVCLGALLKLMQSQHPICILIHHSKDAVDSFLWCVFLLR